MKQDTVILRQATHEDLDRMVELIHSYVDEMPPGAPPLDEEFFRSNIVPYVENTVVAVIDGEIGGFLIMGWESFLWSPQQFMADRAFYVHPDYRRFKVADKLIMAAKELRKAHDMPFIMAAINGVDVERKDKFYEYHGFTRLGGVYGMGCWSEDQ